MMPVGVQKLTTTSYAVLGLLAIKPWTTYELAQQISRSGQFWLRSRSKLFEEPKKLVAHGLAEARADQVGHRPRTVYSITDTGRAALADWLAAPGEPPVLESEQLLKVFFADQGTRDDLLATVAALRGWAEAELTRNVTLARSYLAGLGRFPERTAVNLLVGRYHTDFAEMTLRWADWAADVVRTWPDRVAGAEPDRAALAELAGRDAGR
jgi:DNA-binding PadR family transcriptional regulator